MREERFTKALRKSSRSKADLFELLITESLAKHYKVKRDFSQHISNLEKFILAKFKDGQLRVEEQGRRAKRTSQKLIKFLKKEGIDNIRDVDWIGRYHKKKQTLSDVDLTLENGELIGISLKSTRIGPGTQKNMGYNTLKEYLSLDIDRKLEKMWRNIRAELKQRGGALESLSSTQKTTIKNKKREYPIIKKIGRKYGRPVQIKSVKQSIGNFNSLDEKKKSSFMRLLFGLKEGKRKLLNVIAQKDSISIYWNEIYNSLISGKDLEAKKVGDVSYGIYLKENLIIRLQASFTNGIGISPYCQRAFLLQ